MIKYLTVILLTVISSGAFAEGFVTFTWSPNTEPDLAGYKLYLGTETANYSVTEDVGSVTSHQVALGEGQDYFAALTAYDTSGNESGFSTEVAFTVPNVAPAPPQGFGVTVNLNLTINVQ